MYCVLYDIKARAIWHSYRQQETSQIMRTLSPSHILVRNIMIGHSINIEIWRRQCHVALVICSPKYSSIVASQKPESQNLTAKT